MPGETSKSGPPIDPRLVALLLLLSATTGLVDAVSVLSLGQVFTANMTGNVVFLGFALAGERGFRWPLYIAALASFALGAFVADGLARQHAGRRRRWLIGVASAEAGLLVAAGMISLVSGHLTSPGALPAALAMIGLMSTAMGVRNATVRAMKAPDLTTTVLTLTIAGLAADLLHGQGPAMRRRLLAVAAILAGAILGAMLLRFGPAVPLWLAASIVLGATALLVRKSEPTVTA